jgi:hypothetical protein
VLAPRLRLLVRGRKTATRMSMGKELVFETNGDWVWKQAEDKHEYAEQFLWLYGDGVRMAFTEETRFGGLGGQRLTIAEALQRLMGELRQSAPRMSVDERLMQQPRLRLPLVDEDRGHELLADLMFQAVREGLWE